MSKPEFISVAIGDSVTANFHIDSTINMLKQMWFGKKHGWYAKVIKRIRMSGRQIEMYNFSSAGSRFISNGMKRFVDKLINMVSIEEQVSKTLALKSFPNLFIFLTGHNELDWTKSNLGFDEFVADFSKSYTKQIERVCMSAMHCNHKVSIIIFGLLNYRNHFDLRLICKQEKEVNPRKFPYYDKCYDKFPSLLPVNRTKTIELTDKIDVAIRSIAEACAAKYGSDSIHISYSNVFSLPVVHSTEFVTEADGWHPSDLGQEYLADVALPIIEKELGFLGIR